MGERNIVLVAACALVDTDGRVLIARRPEGKTMAGLWEFPGGKVEPGETPEETIIRELEEELGLTTKPDGLAPLAFARQALKWVRPRDLRDYPMPPADAPLVPFLVDLI
jgi:8-oxo-dGTP diphosphatase